MSYELNEAYENEKGGEISGRDSLNFVPEKHHTASVDRVSDTSPGASHANVEAQEPDANDPDNSAYARHGVELAMGGRGLKGETPNFTNSVGCFSTGPDHKECFESALRDSGGVRQGDNWCSDPAPGVQRHVVPHTVTLDTLQYQDQGSGRTFESQRRANWVKD